MIVCNIMDLNIIKKQENTQKTKWGLLYHFFLCCKDIHIQKIGKWYFIYRSSRFMNIWNLFPYMNHLYHEENFECIEILLSKFRSFFSWTRSFSNIFALILSLWIFTINISFLKSQIPLKTFWNHRQNF